MVSFLEKVSVSKGLLVGQVPEQFQLIGLRHGYRIMESSPEDKRLHGPRGR
jgi:hypothetical protein